MNPFVYRNPEQMITGGSYWDKFLSVPGMIDAKVPTFDRSLDAYFGRSFPALIREWDLVTDSDLHRLESRLARVSDEISRLSAGKAAIEARVRDLDTLITSLEERT